jgi:tRNA threonylcarbamoyladenosine biosynthesis protein TsaB
MIVLALDTAASVCAACLFDTHTSTVLGRASEDIGRGHAERLMAVIDDALSQSGLDLSDVGRIAVTTGPGSFTGVRVGLSAARGLALALDVPCIGVTTLEAIAHAHHGDGDRPLLVVLDARRGEVYAQLFGSDRVALAPQAMSLEAAAAFASAHGADLAGSGTALVKEKAVPPGGGTDSLQILALTSTPDIGDVAAIAAGRPETGPPKVQAGFVLERESTAPA